MQGLGVTKSSTDIALRDALFFVYAQGCVVYIAALQHAPRAASRGRNLPLLDLFFTANPFY